MRKFTLLFFVLTAFIGLNAQNLMPNGGFETWKADNTPENWMGKKTSIDSSNVAKSDVAFEGVASVKLINTGTSHKRFTTDSLEVKAGVSYQITFAIKGEGNIRTGLYDSRATGSGYATYNPYVVATAEWAEHSQTIVAQKDTNIAEFIFSVQSTGADGILLDSVAIQELANGAEILSFVLAEEIAPAMINSETAQVTSTVAWDTDLTALTPEITISAGAQVTPTTGTTLDFSDVVTYEVTAEDGTKKVWSVAVVLGDKPAEVTIHDIQFTEDASGDSPYKGKLVVTSGVVTGVNANGFFIQDGAGAWNGVWVYSKANAANVAVGDNITITGMVDEYYNLTEILDLTDLVVNSSGNDVPAATLVTIPGVDESMEGVIATVELVKCVVEANNYGEWLVADATPDTLMLDTDLFEYVPTVGEEFVSLTGCVTYSFGDFRILPRNAADIVTVGISDQQLSEVSLYPNPVNSSLTIANLEGVSQISISNILGQQVLVKTVTAAEMTINTSALRTGVYIVTLKADNGLTRSERIVKE